MCFIIKPLIGGITINSNYEIIISSQLKNTNMDQDTKDWFMKYDHPEFIEYHNDIIFQR